MNEDKKEGSELRDEQLKDVAGGLSENRYNPTTCSNLVRINPKCYGHPGPLGITAWCDHLRREPVAGTFNNEWYFTCVKLAFPRYRGKTDGTPVR